MRPAGRRSAVGAWTRQEFSCARDTAPCHPPANLLHRLTRSKAQNLSGRDQNTPFRSAVEIGRGHGYFTIDSATDLPHPAPRTPMLLLVRLLLPRQYETMVRCLDALPPSPPACSAVAVRCDTLDAVESALRWRQITGMDVALPLALVIPRDAEAARRIALEATPPTALLFVDELHEGRLPGPVLETLWSAGILGRLEETVHRQARADLCEGDRLVLRRLVAAGAAGRRSKGAAEAAVMSESALRRWLREKGLPSPGVLLRSVRLDAVREHERLGLDAGTAGRLCGWSDTRAAALARRRHGVRRSLRPTGR